MKFREKTDEDLTKISIRLNTSDLDYLREAYQTIGYNRTVRAIVRRFVRRCRQDETNSNKIIDLTQELNQND